jgi:hypothetical protein
MLSLEERAACLYVRYIATQQNRNAGGTSVSLMVPLSRSWYLCLAPGTYPIIRQYTRALSLYICISKLSS